MYHLNVSNLTILQKKKLCTTFNLYVYALHHMPEKAASMYCRKSCQWYFGDIGQCFLCLHEKVSMAWRGGGDGTHQTDLYMWKGRIVSSKLYRCEAKPSSMRLILEQLCLLWPICLQMSFTYWDILIYCKLFDTLKLQSCVLNVNYQLGTDKSWL